MRFATSLKMITNVSMNEHSLLKMTIDKSPAKWTKIQKFAASKS